MAAGNLQRVPKECRAAYLAALTGLLESAAATGSISGAAWREYTRAAAAVRLAGAGQAMQQAFTAVSMAVFSTFYDGGAAAAAQPAEPGQVVPFRS